MYNDPSGHWIESALDVAGIAYDVYDIRQNGLNWENGLSLVADAAGLALPFATGGGLLVRGLTHLDDAADVARAVNAVDNTVDAVKVGDELIDTTSLLAQHFERAGEFGIQSADALKAATKGSGLQVHHIVEQRFARTLGINQPGDMLSVALTMVTPEGVWREPVYWPFWMQANYSARSPWTP